MTSHQIFRLQKLVQILGYGRLSRSKFYGICAVDDGNAAFSLDFREFCRRCARGGDKVTTQCVCLVKRCPTKVSEWPLGAL